MPVLPSYRNQSTDLHSKSIDRFLDDANTGFYCVKLISKNENRLKFWTLKETFDQKMSKILEDHSLGLMLLKTRFQEKKVKKHVNLG